MTTSESRRHDLYNGLIEVIGNDRADTLMRYLPSIEGSELATRTDVHAISNRIDDVEKSLTTRIDNVEKSLGGRIDGMNQRLDRLVLTMAAGLMAIIATLVAQTFF